MSPYKKEELDYQVEFSHGRDKAGLVHSLTPREEILRLQKKIYRENQATISASVIHQDNSFKAYERAYLRAVRKYQKIWDHNELSGEISAANIILVGDYHTLNQSQRSFLRIVRNYLAKAHLVKVHKIVFAFEVIRKEHQPSLDKYLAGRISESTFLKKIQFKDHWFFDLWPNFKPIFEYAKEQKIPIYGLETAPEAGLTLEQRDRAWAETLTNLFADSPLTQIFALVGDLHLAPAHLPRHIASECRTRQLKCRPLILYQNSVAIYWQLAEKELEQEVNLVRIAKAQFCRMHTPPIIAQQSYLNWLDHEEGELDFAQARGIFMDHLQQIANLMAIPLGNSADAVEVFTSGDLSFLKKLKESKKFSIREIKEIKRQILRSQSYTIPRLKFIYLANMSVNHVAEEASHTLKFLLSGEEKPRGMQDAFYANIINEAIGFFGSKLINHKRKCLRPGQAKRLLDFLEKTGAKKERALEYEIAKLFLEHEKLIKSHQVLHTNRISFLSIDLFLGVTHAIGYYLGERMFYGLMQEILSKAEISQLYFDRFEEDGAPYELYLDLMDQTKQVKLPQRF